MIIEIGGGKGGFKEYLETGQKKGRELHRDQLDQRIPLLGNLDTFEIATSIHGGDGRLYDHITLSFAEHHVSDEMLQAVADEFRDHALSAWPESERHRIAIYAEAHRPKILSYTNAETGEHVDRLIHVHFGIGRHDLQTGEAIEPLGYLGPQADNLKYIDAFQEGFNARHGYASPKDNPKITPENAVDILARYTGAKPNALGKFNERKAAIEISLQKEIIFRNITTWAGVEKLLSEHGAVSRMNKGKFNECFRIKPHGAEKAMRLSGVFFQRQFVERPTQEKLAIISEKAKTAYLEQMQPRKTQDYIATTLAEWHQTKAREHRYLHTGSPFYRDVYKPADAQARRRILDDIERKIHAITSTVPSLNRKIATTRNRVPGLPIRDLDGIQKRSEMLLFGDNGVDVLDESKGQEPSSMGVRQANGNRGGISIDADNNDPINTIGDPGGNSPGPSTSTGQPVRGSGRRAVGGASGSGQLPSQPSSVIDRLAADLRERYERAEDKERYTEIRQNLDCVQLLASLSHSHGLNPDFYNVVVAKDGTPRIQCGSRALTPSDFLTKEMGLPWKEAAPILRSAYEQQINCQVTQPRSTKAAHPKLWKEFKAKQQSHHELSKIQLKAFDSNAQKRRATLAEKLKEKQKSALFGLSGAMRKAEYSRQKLRIAIAKAEFEAVIQEERNAFRDSIQLPQPVAWRLFLQSRAEFGDEVAIAELKRIDAIACTEQATLPTITGIIILDHEDEKTRRRRVAALSVSILKSLSSKTDRSTGDVLYSRNGREILRDEGTRFAVLNENSDEAIMAGLLLAQQKFGSNLTLTGSAEFQRRVVQVAVAQGIAVKFVDPRLEVVRQQLVSERRQAKQEITAPLPPSKQKKDISPDPLAPSILNQQATEREVQAREEAATKEEDLAVVPSNQTAPQGGASAARSEAKAVEVAAQPPIETFLERHQGLIAATKAQVAVGKVTESCGRYAVLSVGRGVQVLHQFKSPAELEMAVTRGKEGTGRAD